MVPERIDLFDRHVGQRIRTRRRQAGLTQAQLAEMLGVTSQMVYKYERCFSRISAGQLHAVAVALGTEVAFFFEHADADSIGPDQPELKIRLVELMADVLRIANLRHRLAVCAVAKAMASHEAVDEEVG